MPITDNLTQITFTCNSIVTTIPNPTEDSLQSIIDRLRQNESITSLALYGTSITNKSIYNLVASIASSVPTTSQDKSPSVLHNTHLITLHLHLKLTIVLEMLTGAYCMLLRPLFDILRYADTKKPSRLRVRY